MAGLSLSLALLVAVGLWITVRDDPYVAPRPPAAAPGVQPAEAAELLQQLSAAISTGDTRAAAELAAAGDRGTASRLRALVGNAERVGLRDVSLRYVDELGGAGPSGVWSATATTTWRVAGVDETTAAADVRVDFTTVGDRVVVSGLGGRGGVTPVWMSGPVQAVRRGGVVVLAADRAGRYAGLARRAVDVVRRVLPDWDGRLVVEVPRRAAGVDAALDVDRGTFRTVAGVTATADASGRRAAPVHVFLNPAQMQALRPAGAQVVVSHEAVHVAVDAASSSLPVWLSEGFADYVALRDVPLPLSTTAAQVTRQVRREGAPRRLPDDDDFDEGSEYFGAAYEAAWLACRMLADRIGEQELVRLYRSSDGAADFQRTFRRRTGMSVAAFTREWRQRLSDLAE